MCPTLCPRCQIRTVSPQKALLMIFNQWLPILSVEDDVEAGKQIRGIRWCHQCNKNITLYRETKFIPRNRDTSLVKAHR